MLVAVGNSLTGRGEFLLRERIPVHALEPLVLLDVGRAEPAHHRSKWQGAVSTMRTAVMYLYL